MSMNEVSGGPASEDLTNQHTEALPAGEGPHGVAGPHFVAASPQVLARVPDLESAESEVVVGNSTGRPHGRILGTRPSITILAGGGGLLLLAALGLPFLLSSSETSDTASSDESSAWRPDVPAPSAPLAPSWEGASGGPSGWQAATEDPGFSWPETPAISVWNEDSQSSDWAPPSPGQPETQALSEPLGPMRSGGRPGWQMPSKQTTTSAWDGRTDVVAGRDPPSQTGWETQPTPPLGTAGEPITSPNGEAQTPAWQVPQGRVAGQARPELAAPAGAPGEPFGSSPESPPFSFPTGPDPTGGEATPNTSWPYGGGYDAGRGAGDRHHPNSYPSPNSYRLPSYERLGYGAPQSATNRSMAIGDDARAGTSHDYRRDRQAWEQPAQRTADRRADAGAGRRMDTYPEAYRGYPEASRGYREAYRGTLPTGESPPAGTPPGAYPSTGYPAFDDPASMRRSFGPPQPDPSTGAFSTPSYGDATYPPYPQPGVAHFQGGIEKPTGSDVYDRDRSGLY